ncbi:MAG: DNA polymerase III subunit chi [Novosphingobium sp.]|nr:DNA polymerase III subunit chi [Novosphingobium sp.]
MRVDFYQLSRDPAEALIPRLAEQTLKAGERLLVVTGDASQALRISQALWAHQPESFLAHGAAGEGSEERQPILLSDAPEPANGARFAAFADGVWRGEARSRFERLFHVFSAETIEAARAAWRELGENDAVERHFWKQEGGRWVEGP